MNFSEASLGVLLRLAHQQWTDAIQTALEAAGFGDIRPHHASVFTFARPEGIQASELAQLSRVRKQSMAQQIDELERLGYVERRADPADRRSRLIVLTEKGSRVRPAAMEAGERVQAQWARRTTPQFLSGLTADLAELVARVTEEPDAKPSSVARDQAAR